jgi:tetratricopeptide (TPR) repeat protein
MTKFKITKQGIWAVGGVVVLLLAMTGVGMLVWWLQNKDTLPTNGPGTISQTAEKPLNTAADEAQDLAVGGNVAASNKKLEEALAQPNIPTEDKQQLLVQQGVNYGNSGDYAKALQIYLEAEKSKSDFTTSHLIGEAYEALGDKPKAIEYFKKSISQLNPNAISYNSDKQYYEGKVKELGGTL